MRERMATKNYPLSHYWLGLLKYAEKYPNQRWGQAAFNYLCQIRPDLSEQVRSTDLDPFYVDSAEHPTFVNFSAWLRLNW